MADPEYIEPTPQLRARLEQFREDHEGDPVGDIATRVLFEDDRVRIWELHLEPGEASEYMIAYNFRLKWVNQGGTPLKPLGREVDRQRYALAIRALEKHGKDKRYVSWPHRNYARESMISSGPPARQLEYPDGDWATRSAVWRSRTV